MRRTLTSAILAGCLLLSGCADVTELGDRAIVQLAAIDHDGSEYKLSCLLFSAGGSGGTIDVTKDNVIKVTGSGETLSEAIEQVSLIDGKDIYMSEAKLIVLGSGFEQQDVISSLMMLYRDMRCSLSTPICCAESAELLTDLEFTEGITAAEKPFSMIRNAELMAAAQETTLLDVLSGNEADRAVMIPSFEESKNGSGMTTDENGRTAVLNGSRFISDGHLKGFADMEQTTGYLLLTGLADSVALSYTADGHEYRCEAYNITADITAPDKVRLTADYRSTGGEPLSDKHERIAEKELNVLASHGAALIEKA